MSTHTSGNVAYEPAAPLVPSAPEATCPQGGQCFADVPSSNPFYAFINRIYQQELVTGYPCGGVGEPCDAQNRPYYRPVNNVTRQQMAKFIDNARRLPKIDIETSTDTSPVIAGSTAPNSTGIYGFGTHVGVMGQVAAPDAYAIFAEHDSNDPSAHGAAIRADAGTATGIYAHSTSGDGVEAQSTSGYGVDSYSTSSVGVRGESDTGTGVLGGSNSGPGVEGGSASGYGVWAQSGSNDGLHTSSNTGNGLYATSTSGYAGYFQGNVNVTGTCCQASLGSYRIDDPNDPANKYLYQAAVTSSDMLDLYTGHATLDASGQAWVEMPSWFQALNEDFDYQLTCVGGYAPVYVAHEIANNRFQIAGGTAGLKVSWQVTGHRHDPYAQQHPVPTERNKPAGEQGTYLHPELYGQPDSKRVASGK